MFSTMKVSQRVVICLCLQIGVLLAQQPGQEPGGQQEPEGETVVPITEITERAQETHLSLSKIREAIGPSAQITAIEDRFPALLDSLEAMRADSIYGALERLSARRLNNLSQRWTPYLNQLNGWVKALKAYAEVLERHSEELQKEQTLWQRTAEELSKEDMPEAIRDRVKSILDEIASIRTSLQERGEALLTILDDISREQVDIAEQIDRIRAAESAKLMRLFELDSPPLWRIAQADLDTLRFGQHLSESWHEIFEANSVFLKVNRERLIIHLLIFLMLLALTVYLNHRNKRDQLIDANDDVLRAAAFFVSRPVSAALLVSLVLSVWLYPDRPVTFRELLFLLALIPIVRLLSGVAVPELRLPIYFLAGLYALNLAQELVASNMLLRRVSLLAITIFAISLFGWCFKPDGVFARLKRRRKKTLIPRLALLVPVFLGVSLVANVIGSVVTAHQLTNGVIEGINLAMGLYATALVTTGLVVLLIRRRSARVFHFVTNYGELIERRSFQIISITAVLLWLYITFRNWGLLQPLQEWYADAIDYTWAIGSVEISLNSILSFVFILLAAYGLTRLSRIILELEVFPRLRLPRGVPGAVSMLVRYSISGFGLFLAISAAGVDLGKFALLAGALGVGLGFGLRNIIENFVSGLIVAFERPVQIGDTIEIGAIMGDVKEIGVRSSTVTTFDGSEVIVPNADIISNQVTNWTLSDARRRIKLPVKVAYGSNPKKVLDSLLEVASEHPAVLKNPEPMATFDGFGDNFLDFTLYYWLADNFLKTKSEVALGVHDIIKASGIEPPRPQRDLNLRLIDALEVQQSLADHKKSKPQPTRNRRRRRPQMKNAK